MTEVLDRVRAYWDLDARTYDQAPEHRIGSTAEQAAWQAALVGRLPDPPARVLDVGAGTGFLALLCARLGHHVTALDLSAEMLARLGEAARAVDLDVTVVHGPAHEPPAGPFDAVVERHLLWTLPDPHAELTAWRAVAPAGRLLLFEGLWGQADPGQALRQRARQTLRRLRRAAPAHHASYDPDIRDRLPYGGGATPDDLIEAAAAAGWRTLQLARLRDVEWCRLLRLPPAERLLGTTPQYVISAA